MVDIVAHVNSAGQTTVWSSATAYSLGDTVHTTSLYGMGTLFECTTAGTSGGSEPSWDGTIGNTTADSTIVWTAIRSTDFTKSFMSVDRATASENPTPNIILVEKDSNDSGMQGPGNDYNLAGTTSSSRPTSLFSVDSSTMDYSPTDPAGSGTVNIFTGLTLNILIKGTRFFGLSLSYNDIESNNIARCQLIDCYLKSNINAGAYGALGLRLDNFNGMLEIINSTYKHNKTGARIWIEEGHETVFRGVTFDMTGHATSLLYAQTWVTNFDILFEDCDFSACGTTTLLDNSPITPSTGTASYREYRIRLVNCTLPVSFLKLTTAINIEAEKLVITYENCAYVEGSFINERESIEGKVDTLTSVYMLDGYKPSDSSNPISQKLAPSLYVNKGMRLSSVYFSGTLVPDGAKTITVEILENFTTALTAGDIYVELWAYNSATDANHSVNVSSREVWKTTYTALPTGVGVGQWVGTLAGGRSSKISFSANFLKVGYYKAVVYLTKYEAGKVAVINPELIIS